MADAPAVLITSCGGHLMTAEILLIIAGAFAGGFVNGFTAEGIYYAMISGDLAAKTIAASWPSEADELARPYRRAVNREMGHELRDSVLIQRYLFGDRRRIAAAIAAAPRQGAMTTLILDLAIGRRSYSDVRRRIFARAPLLAARLAWDKVIAEIRIG